MITDVYGDSEVIRRRVRDLREQGEDIRALAGGLVERTEQLPWAGRAAAALTERIAERAERLHATAGHHDTAADALAAHGLHVQDVQDRIAAVEQRFAAEVDASTTDRALPFTPPPPGHKAWLDVDLPES
jgi:hypothetical protein